MALDHAGFTQQLRQRFGDFLGDPRPVGPRFCYPLSLQYAATAIGRRLALIGDALHAMHPIAGQGLNMGFRDVAALVDVLAMRPPPVATWAPPRRSPATSVGGDSTTP